MDINRSFEILELDRGASVEEAKQAYKDIANVWHPDRFSHNPRLREKAEKKLKEVNLAYETVRSFLSQKGDASKASGRTTNPKTQAKGAHTAKSTADAATQDRTERAFELGTRVFLEVCSHLYTTFRQVVGQQHSKKEGERQGKRQGATQNARPTAGRHAKR